MTGWMAESLTWEFEYDPTMRCPECNDGPVDAAYLLRHGWAECQHCSAEYSASITLETAGDSG